MDPDMDESVCQIRSAKNPPLAETNACVITIPNKMGYVHRVQRFPPASYRLPFTSITVYAGCSSFMIPMLTAD